MLDNETKPKREKAPSDRDGFRSPEPATRDVVSPPAAAPDYTRAPRMRIVPFLITLAVVALAVPLGWMMWDVYMGSPWTRDGTVRANVVTIAPEVAGRIVELPIADNQLVHKGDLLMVIDPTNFQIAVRQGEAAVNQAKATAENAQAELNRRQLLTDLAVTQEEKQTFASNALSTAAALEQAMANLAQARVNLERSRIYSPVNGYVTNLLVQRGDYVNVGQNRISLVDADFSGLTDISKRPISKGSARATPLASSCWATARSFVATSIALRGPSTSRMRNPTNKGSPRSTRSLPGCGSPSVFRYASTSIRCRRA